MIWLASFPRSGNTFFRNVLYEVYGLESSTWHMEANYPLEPDYDRFPVVKTHLLPHQLKPASPSIPKVYIVREGRDALVSMAHHRKDIVEPGTDFYVNLLEAILAMDGSYFGGWSENVRQWMEVADIVIRFEDLIADPIREVEKLRAVMDLPAPRVERLPTFQDLKFGKPQYGSGRKTLDADQAANMAQVNFRRGKSGAWKDEMPPELEQLFWELHGEQMLALGYERGTAGDKWLASRKSPKEPYRILIEGNKTEDPHMDGVRRYLEELLFGLVAFQRRQPEKWRIDVLTQGKIIPLMQYFHRIEERRELERQSFGVLRPVNRDGEYYLLRLKMAIKSALPGPVYDALSPVYRALPIRRVLAWLRGATVEEKYQQAWKEASATHQLVHVPLPQNCQFARDLDLPLVVTVHDLTHRLFPQYHEQHNVDLTEKGMRLLEGKARRVIAVSRATHKDLLEAFPTLEGRTEVIHEAANADRFSRRIDPALWTEVRERYGLPDRPFFLSLSTLEPRKNLSAIVEGFLRMVDETGDTRTMLVVCGRKGWKHEQLVGNAQGAEDRVRFTGHVLDDDLPWLYSQALALCYVPHYEGFGLPPLEAMRCGSPVIYADNSALPEVIGDAGIAVDPQDVAAIATAMARLAGNRELRHVLGETAYVRARHFSWLKTAFQTLRIYEEVVEEQSAVTGDVHHRNAGIPS